MDHQYLEDTIAVENFRDLEDAILEAIFERNAKLYQHTPVDLTNKSVSRYASLASAEGNDDLATMCDMWLEGPSLEDSTDMILDAVNWHRKQKAEPKVDVNSLKLSQVYDLWKESIEDENDSMVAACEGYLDDLGRILLAR